MTHVDLAEWAAITFNLPGKLGRSTIGNILRNAPCIGCRVYGDGKRRKPFVRLSEIVMCATQMGL
ncbi:hypothetical protein PR003_g7382 [Phytophthora rubi]|uniref:Uncharacterized protein n=1 Tax=Phytophthora rubi TaxID=129364 RepID=A0A6A3NH54_9STRA|nr:hypothetical protein PR001_g6849 [Phytophthora rubi]KAE9346542.1 hypothetical protein PR003_g7382 [Phytophthora rubi]